MFYLLVALIVFFALMGVEYYISPRKPLSRYPYRLNAMISLAWPLALLLVVIFWSMDFAREREWID